MPILCQLAPECKHGNPIPGKQASTRAANSTYSLERHEVAMLRGLLSTSRWPTIVCYILHLLGPGLA